MKIEIGGCPAVLAAGFVDAWKRAEAGETGPTLRVHDDAIALEEAGLIERDGNRLLLLAMA